jgi:hypothetical protein
LCDAIAQDRLNPAAINQTVRDRLGKMNVQQ